VGIAADGCAHELNADQKPSRKIFNIRSFGSHSNNPTGSGTTSDAALS
jgi:hypothetical protein